MIYASIVVSVLLVLIDIFNHLGRYDSYSDTKDNFNSFMYVLGFIGGTIGRMATIWYLVVYALTL